MKAYKQYIDLGCHFITTCNYGFKSKKLDNWESLVHESVKLISQVKNKNQEITILGCLPPYFESYYDGEIDSDFNKLSYSFKSDKKNPSFFCLAELSEKWKKLISNS